ncbi:MAG: chorismate synthase [bacterium]|nr:chorismate synthase [bacterium]
MANTFGNQLTITSFGESHGPFIGVVIDGLPSNIFIDTVFIQKALDRRKPGQSNLTTQRQESDVFQIVSGVFNEYSTGSPIAILIPNKDALSKDYEALKNVYRPGHADFVYDKKYGNRDYKGGGRSSARITAGWVAAGAIASLYLKTVSNIEVKAMVSSIYNIALPKPYDQYDWNNAENNAVRCPDPDTADAMETLIERIKMEGNSVGGTIACKIKNAPIGLGEPLFNKLNAELAKAMLSINAVKGIQFGSGFDSTQLLGSQNNDNLDNHSNHDGGITAGISNGETILFELAFKPTSSISIPQTMLNTTGDTETVSIPGRHDPCVLPRAVPIVEAMAALVLADHYLLNLKYLK